MFNRLLISAIGYAVAKDEPQDSTKRIVGLGLTSCAAFSLLSEVLDGKD